MAKAKDEEVKLSESDIADDIRDFLGRNGINAWAVPWPDFYEVVDRIRIRNDFKEKLEEELSKRSILISYGQAIVLIARDYAAHNLTHEWNKE